MLTDSFALTVAASVARFTLASSTPGTLLSARSTRATQEAHVIPSTGKDHCRGAVEPVGRATTDEFTLDVRLGLVRAATQRCVQYQVSHDGKVKPQRFELRG